MENCTKWIKRAVKKTHKHSSLCMCALTRVSVCVCVCVNMHVHSILHSQLQRKVGWEREHNGHITNNRHITDAENLMIILRHTNSDIIQNVPVLSLSLSLSLSHTHSECGLRAAAASSPHFFVDVLLQLKLWLVGLLHGPVLQLSETQTETQTLT